MTVRVSTYVALLFRLPTENPTVAPVFRASKASSNPAATVQFEPARVWNCDASNRRNPVNWEYVRLAGETTARMVPSATIPPSAPSSAPKAKSGP